MNGYPHPSLAAFGRDLRRIAEQFEKSKERESIKKRADDVNLESIRYEEFHHLLQNLFSNGVSRERIVVLFFFCSDLAYRAATSGTFHLCRLLFTWSLTFVIDRVCLWVQTQGGWAVVLGEYFPRFAVTACAVLGCIAFGIYIKRYLTGNWNPALLLTYEYLFAYFTLHDNVFHWLTERSKSS